LNEGRVDVYVVVDGGDVGQLEYQPDLATRYLGRRRYQKIKLLSSKSDGTKRDGSR